MSSKLNFHGNDDEYQNYLGKWKIKQRENRYAHTVKYARHVIYRFTGHTHPYAQRLMWELIDKDVDGLQRLDTEVKLRAMYFKATYAPTKIIGAVDPAECGTAPVAIVATRKEESNLEDEGLPVHDLDFDYQSGAYAVYNWEVFYHAPYTIALHLSKNGRYAEAQRWFHYIFDPTDNSVPKPGTTDNSNPELGPKRFWKVKPFKIDEVEHIQDVLFNVATGDDPVARDETVRAIGAWRDNPFRPHLVARTRPSAYMYATAMAYLDNLIAWGDSLFRQDTRESINEAMQIYVLAANILGPRPQPIPKRGSNKKQTYASLKKNLDEFGNAAVKLEAEIGFDLFPPPQAADLKPENAVLESIGRSLYFCVPSNEKLKGYWDTVGDRLFKIRNSQNLQGAFRQLALFAPPIDPAMLARAVAAGVDVGAIINGTGDNLLPVRFQYLLQKALEMAQEVKSLGSQILAAMEKKDNETLGVLRAKHEANMLGLAEAVRYAQWQEAIKAREGVTVNLANAFERFRHYDRLLGTEAEKIKQPAYVPFDRTLFEGRSTKMAEPRVDAADPEIRFGTSVRDGGHKISEEEAKEITLLQDSQTASELSTILQTVGSVLNLIPDFAGRVTPFGVGAGATFGGSQVGNFASALSMISRFVADSLRHESGMAGKMASFNRREQDWAFQRKAAAGELTQLYKQFRAAEIREYIAKREHEHHLTQIQQSKDVLEFLTNEQNLRTGDQRKTTTEDFYLWMKREAQALHAKCYQFAYDVAKKAEKALQHELGDQSKQFIQSGYLAGKEGLFAGEKLYFDIKRMEMAYVELNTRAYEITKHVSLKEWFPLQLIQLRRGGECSINLPEALFDLDCPGHSFRRIKSVAVSIPCITGPYASVNCSVTLGESSVRRNNTSNYESATADFDTSPAAVKSVVTSSSQGDSGMFETNLRDERYLPFEGAGAISTWSLELLGEPRSFDYDTISDVVLTIRYTARSEGNKQEAKKAAVKWLKAHSARVFSMRHEFGSEWAAFKRPIDPAAAVKTASLKFSLDEKHFSYRMKNIADTKNPKPKKLHIFFTGSATGGVELFQNEISLGKMPTVDGAFFTHATLSAIGKFELVFDSNALTDLWLVVDWS